MSLCVDIEKKLSGFYLKVNFTINEESMAIVGASGAGKSITLKCIAGIVKPDRGRIILDEKVFYDSEKGICIPSKERGIGYLFQNYALFPNMTVEENIVFGMKGKKQRNKELVKDYINRYYLNGCEKLYPHQLSGGQQQRTALARMLAASPGLLLLDEPLSALDPFLRRQTELDIANTIKEFRGNSILVSHNMEEVYRLCEKALILQKGSVVMEGEKEQLFRKPETLSAALLMGLKNISRAKKKNDYSILALDWGIEIQTDETVRNDIKYVGIPSSEFRQVFEMEPCNVVECCNPIVMEDISYMSIQFYHRGEKQLSDWSMLRFEPSKEVWKDLNSKERFYLKISKSQVVQMR